MSKTINLEFDGYYRENSLPLANKHTCSGIYAVYAGEPPDSNNNCSLRKLLYIGESENAATRPGKAHENYTAWKKKLKEDELLYFTFCDVSSADRKRAEAALIYHNQPCCNEQNMESFSYPETTIETSRRASYLGGTFTVP
jgi:hypothetical protein